MQTKVTSEIIGGDIFWVHALMDAEIPSNLILETWDLKDEAARREEEFMITGEESAS